jgi:hypothetical protein
LSCAKSMQKSKRADLAGLKTVWLGRTKSDVTEFDEVYKINGLKWGKTSQKGPTVSDWFLFFHDVRPLGQYWQSGFFLLPLGQYWLSRFFCSTVRPSLVASSHRLSQRKKSNHCCLSNLSPNLGLT